MSTKITEQLLSAVNNGRSAEFAYRHLKAILDLQVSQTLSKMKADFRSGQIDPVAIQCKLAELCAIEDIENKFKQQITAGDRAISQTQGDNQ